MKLATPIGHKKNCFFFSVCLYDQLLHFVTLINDKHQTLVDIICVVVVSCSVEVVAQQKM